MPLVYIPSMRRVLSALLMLLTLRVSMVDAGVPCATHDMAATSAPGMDMSHQDHGAANATTNKDSRDIPAQQECCRALASCATGLLARATEVVALLPARVDRPIDDSALLSSRIAPPDTPPPRA